MRSYWTLPLALLVAGLSALQAAAALPAPAFAATGVKVGEDSPALAYAGAGTLHNGLYTSVYDDFGGAFHSQWPVDVVWNGAELPTSRTANAFRTNWKPGITRRETAIHTPVDLRTAYKCKWEVRPGSAAVSVPIGVACSPVEVHPEDHFKRALPTSPQQSTAEQRAVPDGDASASTPTNPLPPYLGEAAQLVMQQSGSGQQVEDGAYSRPRRQVPLVRRRGASSSASSAASSASSGPWGSSASSAASSAASGANHRPGYYGYGNRPGVYGQRPTYGRPYPGTFYG